MDESKPMMSVIGAPVQTPVARRCPVCDSIVDGATQIGGPGAQPEPGDVSICYYCATSLIFTEEGFSVMHPSEVVLLKATNYDFRTALNAVIEKIRER